MNSDVVVEPGTRSCMHVQNFFQVLKDWHLAIYVAVLVAIDVVLLSVVTAIPEAQSIGKLVTDQEHPPFRDVSSNRKLMIDV